MVTYRAMEKRAPTAKGTDEFAEKSFYLDEFRSRSLCFSIQAANLSSTGGLADLALLIRQLIGNDTRVILLLGNEGSDAVTIRKVSRTLREHLATGRAAVRLPQRHRRPSLAGLVKALDTEQSDRELSKLWTILRRAPLFVGIVPAQHLLETSQWITGRLRVFKWVVLEPHGGIVSRSGSPISFIDNSVLTELLRAGAAEWSGIDGRKDTLRAVQKALRLGVKAVNLCAPADVETELFTYEGSGTLFTPEDYCRIDPLGIDDFEEVERLLERGHREGFLKGRDKSQIGAILLNGFGATIGERHLAGICGLLTSGYENAGAGEVAGLYTFTRFKGEGVGARLLARLLTEATGLGLAYVFACTTDANAAAFFARHGFEKVARSAVPAAKWRGYDPTRLRSVTVLKHILVDRHTPDRNSPRS